LPESKNYTLGERDTVESTVYVKRTLSSDLSVMIFCIAVAVLGGAGSLFAFSTAIKSGITLQTALFGSLAGFAVTLFLCVFRFFDSKKGGVSSLRIVFLTALILLTLIYVFREECADAIMGLLAAFYENRGEVYVYADTERAKNINYLLPLCLFSASEAAAVFYAVSLKRSTAVLILLTMPVPLILMCMGFFPAPLSLCAIAAAVLGTAAYKASERIYTGFFAMVMAVLCMISVNAFVERIALPYVNNLLSEDKHLSEMINDFRGGDTSPQSFKAGAIRHGELSKVGKIRFSGQTVLRAVFPKTDNTIYLRGFIAFDYYNNKWNEISGVSLENERSVARTFSDVTISPLLMDGANIKSDETYSFSVSDLTSNSEYIYLPYTMTPQSAEKFLSPDKTRFVYSLDSYGGSFYGGADLEVYRRIFEFNKILSDENSAEDEMLYRQFVYDNYLTVPDVFTGGELILDEGYEKFISETQSGDDDFKTQMNILSRKLYYIRNRLRENYAYDLNVGEVPEGRDFVNWFLEDTKAGSCSHFASAAVLLCRSAGIPARYVEGYIIKPKDFPGDSEEGESASVEIPDTRAHAWAEIYIDEFGWYPYEFTSGYGNIRTAVTEPTPAETTTAATAAPAVSETVPPETTAPMTAAAEKEEIIAETEEAKTPPSPLLLLILIVPAAIAYLPLRRAVILKSREKREAKFTPAEAVFYAYYEIMPILAKYGFAQNLMYDDFEAFIGEVGISVCGEAGKLAEIAVKTAFGGYEPSEEDKNQVLGIMKRTKDKYYAELPKKQQFREKYLRVFL
jgi:hypothetical protein